MSAQCGNLKLLKTKRVGSVGSSVLAPSHSTSGKMSGIPDTTEERIALIAQGNLDSNGASRFMNTTFDASDYFQTLLDYSERQQLIDGLYKVYDPPILVIPLLPRPSRFFVKALSICQRANVAFGPSGRQEEKLDCFQPVIMLHFHSKNQMRCRMHLVDTQMFGR